MPDNLPLDEYLDKNGYVSDEHKDLVDKIWHNSNTLDFHSSKISRNIATSNSLSWGLSGKHQVSFSFMHGGDYLEEGIQYLGTEHILLYPDIVDFFAEKNSYKSYEDVEYSRDRAHYKGKLTHFIGQPTQYKDIYFTLLENKPKSQKSAYAVIGSDYGLISRETKDLPIRKDRKHSHSFLNPVFGWFYGFGHEYSSPGGYFGRIYPFIPISESNNYVGDKFLDEIGSYFWSTHNIIWDIQLSDDSWVSCGSHMYPPSQNEYWKWGVLRKNDSKLSNESPDQFGWGVNNLHYSFHRPKHRLPWKYWEQYIGHHNFLPGQYEPGEFETGHFLYGVYHPQVEAYVVVELRDEFGQFSGSVGDHGIACWTGHKNDLDKVSFVDPGLDDSIGTEKVDKLGNFYTELPNEDVSYSTRKYREVPLEVYNILEVVDTRVKVFRHLFGMHIHKPSEDLTTVETSKIEMSWVWDESNNPPDSIEIKRLVRDDQADFISDESIYGNESNITWTTSRPRGWGMENYIGYSSFFHHVPWEQILGAGFSSTPVVGGLVETVYSGGAPIPQSDGSIRVDFPPILMIDDSKHFLSEAIFSNFSTTGELVTIGNAAYGDHLVNKIMYGNDGDYVTEGPTSLTGRYAYQATYGTWGGNAGTYWCIATRNGVTYNPEDFFLKRREIEIRHNELNVSLGRKKTVEVPGSSTYLKVEYTPGPYHLAYFHHGYHTSHPDEAEKHVSSTFYYSQNPTPPPVKDDIVFTNPVTEEDVRVNAWRMEHHYPHRYFYIGYNYDGAYRFGKHDDAVGEDRYDWRNWMQPSFDQNSYSPNIMKVYDYWKGGSGGPLPDGWEEWSDMWYGVKKQFDLVSEGVITDSDLLDPLTGKAETRDMLTRKKAEAGMWRSISLRYGYNGEQLYTWDWSKFHDEEDKIKIWRNFNPDWTEANKTTTMKYEWSDKRGVDENGNPTQDGMSKMDTVGGGAWQNNKLEPRYRSWWGMKQFPVAKKVEEVPFGYRRGQGGLDETGESVMQPGADNPHFISRVWNRHGYGIWSGGDAFSRDNTTFTPAYQDQRFYDPLYDPRDVSKKEYEVTEEEITLSRQYQNLRYLTHYLCPVHQFGYTAYPTS